MSVNYNDVITQPERCDDVQVQRVLVHTTMQRIRWSDMDALNEHFRQPGSAELLAAIRDLAAASEAISLYEASPAG